METYLNKEFGLLTKYNYEVLTKKIPSLNSLNNYIKNIYKKLLIVLIQKF